MKAWKSTQRGCLVAALAAAVAFVAPNALAHVHVGVGISVPGVSIGVGNCWRCGYWAPPPPVYYRRVYPAPVYYPPTVYYFPGPVYYGYRYYGDRDDYAPYYYPSYNEGDYYDRGDDGDEGYYGDDGGDDGGND